MYIIAQGFMFGIGFMAGVTVFIIIVGSIATAMKKGKKEDETESDFKNRKLV